MNSLEAKIVVLGAQGVGKTSLVYRFVKVGELLLFPEPYLLTFLCQGSFAPAISTVGASFLAKKVVDDTTDTTIRLQIVSSYCTLFLIVIWRAYAD